MARFANEMRVLAGDILSSARVRREAVAGIKSGVREFMRRAEAERRRGFRHTQQRIAGRVGELATETRKFLSDWEDERASAFQELHGRIAGRVGELATETREFLSDWEDERASAFHEVHGRIAARLRGLRHGTRRMREKFRAELAALRDEIKAAGEAWQSLARVQAGSVTTATLAAQRAAEREDDERNRRAAEEERRHRFAEEERNRRAEQKRKAKDESWRALSDEEKVLRVIRDNPGGVSAAQIGEWVGISPQQAGRIATQLAEDGSVPVRKDEDTKLYYVAPAEA